MLSFELVLQQVELARRLSASSEGLPATAATRSGIRLFTVQGLLRITNRAGKSFSKLSAQRTLLLTIPLSSCARNFSRKIFKNIFRAALDKFQNRFPKRAAAPAKNFRSPAQKLFTRLPACFK